MVCAGYTAICSFTCCVVQRNIRTETKNLHIKQCLKIKNCNYITQLFTWSVSANGLNQGATPSVGIILTYLAAKIKGYPNRQYSIHPLQWRHNGLDNVSNHQPHDCLLNRLFRRRSKKTSKLRVTGRCAGNSPGTGELSAQMPSCAENVSIWWRHHAMARESQVKVFSFRPPNWTAMNGLSMFMLRSWLPWNLASGKSYHAPSKVWEEIPYPFPNFNSCTVEVGE